MNTPMTLNEIEIFSREETRLKPALREVFRFPDGVTGEERSSLREQAIQRIDDIVMFHRFAMFTHMQSHQVVAPIFKAFNEHYNSMFNNISSSDTDKITSTRRTFKNFNDMYQLRQIECIANESLVVNLWATIEQISTRCIETVMQLPHGTRAPYKWKGIEGCYAKINVDLKKFISYSAINELRVLNNKIKHSYVVDDELASFDVFKEHNGDRIDSISLRVFDYTLAAYGFLCYVTNRSGSSIFYPENEEDDDED